MMNLDHSTKPAEPPAIQQEAGDREVLLHQPTLRIMVDPAARANADFLTTLKRTSFFSVEQNWMRLLDIVLPHENSYSVKDHEGITFIFVDEESSLCCRYCFRHRRAFELNFKDTEGQHVMIATRNHNTNCFCGLFWPDEMNVYAPSDGQLLGSVVQQFSIGRPKFHIRDAIGRAVLLIWGPVCGVRNCCRGKGIQCCGPVRFSLLTVDGQHQVGHINKNWSGFARELFTNADNFSISFPVDLDPAIKAVCLAALFLIDYRYYER